MIKEVISTKDQVAIKVLTHLEILRMLHRKIYELSSFTQQIMYPNYLRLLTTGFSDGEVLASVLLPTFFFRVDPGVVIGRGL